MISIILSIVFVISISCITSNYHQYKYIRRTYNIIRHNNITIKDNKNGTYSLNSLGSKSIFYKDGFFYTIRLFDRPMNFLINNWTTYFDPYSLYYLIKINKQFKNKIND